MKHFFFNIKNQYVFIEFHVNLWNSESSLLVWWLTPWLVQTPPPAQLITFSRSSLFLSLPNYQTGPGLRWTQRSEAGCSTSTTSNLSILSASRFCSQDSASSVGSGEFTGLKELDDISQEIAQLQRWTQLYFSLCVFSFDFGFVLFLISFHCVSYLLISQLR